MLSKILHRRPSVTFDANGITVHPLLFGAASIPWHEIKYVSPTPEYELNEGKIWVPRATTEFPSSTQHSTLANSRDLELKLVTNVRFVPMWMWYSIGSIFAKPLYDADDRPKPLVRVVYMQLNTARLSGSVTALFDLLSQHCRFELIATD